MSTRGEAKKRPVTPPDPTLASRSVPRTRNFPARSFGPGAVANFYPRPLKEVDEEAKANPGTYYGPEDQYPGESEDFNLSRQEVRRLLGEVERWQAVSWRKDEYVECDPTWGFYVFITSYSEICQERIPRAMDNWIKLVERSVKRGTRVAYADEAFKRFKLVVIEDKDALADATVDRVRKEFRALIRGFDLHGLSEDDDNSFLVPPARNKACFVLSEADISMLDDLAFPDDPVQDYEVLGEKKLKLIDAGWRRPSVSDTDYRGVWHCSLVLLPYVYDLITGDSNAMEDGYFSEGRP